MDIFEYIFAIFAFLIVLALLMLTTKFLAYKTKKILKGNYMSIVETLSLGLLNRIHLIKVDKEFFIISVSNKSVKFLSKVNINDYTEEEVKNTFSETIDFKSVLKKYVGGINIYNHGSNKNVDTSTDNIDIEKNSDFETLGSDVVFKKNLEKLKDFSNNINNLRGEDEK